MLTDAQFAQLAAATYAPQTQATWTGFTDPCHVHDQSVQAYLAGGEDLTHVGFRGSKTPLEWALDFLAVAVTDHETAEHAKLGPVHAGFLIAAQSLYSRVHMVAESVGNAGKPFALYGHSLGGAIALMTGALLRADGIPVERIVTFGAPRVGFGQYVAALADVAIDEWHYGNDPVPDVPPWLLRARPRIHDGTWRLDFLSCHHMPNYLAATAEAPVAA